MKNLNSFANRWLFSTNHKDLGSLYIIFSLGAGFLGLALSILMRIESAVLGNGIFDGNYQLYNSTGSCINNDIFFRFTSKI